jgi:transcriptional regulator with XRE-family HTH domain
VSEACHAHGMPPRERVVDRGARLARHDLRTIGLELRNARVSRGLTTAEVGAAVGLSRSHVGRIERAVHPAATVGQLARIGAVVGLDVRIRAYPGPVPTRDAGQLKLMRTFRERLHSDLRMELEIPVAVGDQRAWDSVITRFADDPSAWLPAEFDSVVADFQAQVRRITLKAGDAGVDCVLWVVAATHRNRAALREAGSIVDGTFPVSARTALRALRNGRHPGGSSLILI